jgi:hypothetical protein
MSQPASKLPWEIGFVPANIDTGLIGAVTGELGQVEKTVTTDVQQAATQIGSNVAGETASVATTAAATAAAAVAGAVKAAEQVAGAVVGSPPPAPTSSAAPAPTAIAVSPDGGLTGSLITDVEQAAINAAKATTAAILPSIQKSIETRVAAKAQAEVQSVLEKLQGGDQTPVPTLSDFTKADARSRAFRTLLIGLGLSVLWGLVNILGNIATVDWTNKDALPQVLSIATTAVVGSVVAYIGRILATPAHIASATIIPGSTH